MQILKKKLHWAGRSLPRSWAFASNIRCQLAKMFSGHPVDSQARDEKYDHSLIEKERTEITHQKKSFLN